MTTKVVIPLDEALAWQAACRGDEVCFAMHLIRRFIKEGFLFDPDPELGTVEFETRGHEIVFTKFKRDRSNDGT